MNRHHTYYEATQEQRRQERQIRQSKREYETLKAIKATPEELQRAQAKLSKQVNEYKQFSASAGIRAKTERIGVGIYNTSKMATTHGTVWPAYTKPISEKTYKKLESVAQKKNITIDKSFKQYDGDIQIIGGALKSINRIMDDYPEIRQNGVTLAVSYDMSDNDYAKTTGNKITINGNAFRNVTLLEQDYQKSESENWFVKGTTYKDIINHEMGHVYANVHSISGMKVAKSVYNEKNQYIVISKATKDISLYAGRYKNGQEILSETFASVYSDTSENATCLLIKAESDKILIERGHKISTEE